MFYLMALTVATAIRANATEINGPAGQGGSCCGNENVFSGDVKFLKSCTRRNRFT